MSSISSFNEEDGVQAFDASSVASPATQTRSRSHSVASLARTLTREREERLKLEQYVSNHQDGVERVLTQMTERAGALGPAEELLDVQPSKLEAAPDSDFNELDEYKYPIDIDTGLRLVVFVENDKSDPRNWTKSRKWLYTILLGIVCFAVAFASAVVTGDLEGPQETFGVSQEVVILTVTLFVLGFAFGPLLFAPLSEEIGRQAIYTGTLFFALIFILPCALAKNIGTLLVARAIDGLGFSAPLCIIGGSLADMWLAKDRGLAMTVFSAAPFLGPVIGPLVGGYIGDNAGWRWIYWVLMIFVGCVYVVMVAVIPETHHNTILKRRAKHLRKITGDDRYRTLVEIQVRSMKTIMEETLLRPMVLLREVIVFLMTIYMSIIYGLLYMFFFAYPVVYMEGKGWSASKTGLMFIPVAAGVIAASLVSPLINRNYNRRAQKYIDQGTLPPPELRLVPMMISCWFVPIGLFSYAWSSYPRLSWAGPCFSGFACGVGFNMLYNPANNYIVDSYQHYAASALAAKTFVRSLWGASVPLFTIQMYHRLGYEWASSLMAFISLACCAIPFGFYFYGAKIRTWSKYAYSPELESDAKPLEKAQTESVNSCSA